MIKHKYKHLFTLGLACLILSIFAPRRMRNYYPTVHCEQEGAGEVLLGHYVMPAPTVAYYCFAKHTWLLTKEAHRV
jgi:hypothetical protein